MNSKQIKGLPVISIAEGAKVGVVGEAWLDEPHKRVAAFTITDSAGMLAFDTVTIGWLDASHVQAIGPDALMIQDASALTESPPGGNLLAVGDLARRPVVTEGGKELGQISSVEFNRQGLEVTALEISAGLFSGNRQVTADQIVNVGEEMVIVSDQVEVDHGAEHDEDVEDTTASGDRSLVVGDVDELPRESTDEEESRTRLP
jgi:uncharacterized protein YrrD